MIHDEANYRGQNEFLILIKKKNRGMWRINGLEEVTMYYNVVIATFIGDVT